MPELPEAEVVCRQLRAHIRGKAIQSIWIGRDDMVRVGLASVAWYENALIADVQRLGKSVVVECSRNGECRYIVAELGMTGLLLFHRESAPSERHIHVILQITNDTPLDVHYWNARRFGRLSLLSPGELQDYRERRFGIDPLIAEEDEWVSLIKGCRGRVKALLLHQQKIAGVGNIYANEMLFRSGIHPHARGCQLSKGRIRRLYRCMVELLTEAIDKGGSSIRDFLAPDGKPGTFQQWHQVYQRAGQNCVNECGTVIRVLRAERSSFYCPQCQKR